MSRRLRRSAGKRRRPSGSPRRRGRTWVFFTVIVGFAAIAIAGIILGQPRRPEAIGQALVIHNTRCPMSGRLIPPELQGRWRVELEYDGPLDAYRDKTLVFNVGSARCAAQLPELWRTERDAIMARVELTGPPGD